MYPFKHVYSSKKHPTAHLKSPDDARSNASHSLPGDSFDYVYLSRDFIVGISILNQFYLFVKLYSGILFSEFIARVLVIWLKPPLDLF